MHYANVATKIIDDSDDKGNVNNSYVASNVSSSHSRLDLPFVWVCWQRNKKYEYQ